MVDEVVRRSALPDGSDGGTEPAGPDEPSEVLMTAMIKNKISSTAAMPAAEMTAGRSNHDFTSNSSRGTREC